MAATSTIEWCSATWNIVTGCTLVSPGCEHCYAAELAAGRLKNHPSRAGLARRNRDGVAKFTGEVRFNEQWLDDPLRWRRPRMIFVCAHGDLFHEDVPDAWLDRVFAVMALCPQHVFQVLTKRPERMRAYLRRFYGGPDGRVVQRLVAAHSGNKDCPTWIGDACQWSTPRPLSPLPNLWLGVSCEDQARADERIPALLETPAVVRFLSCEPLLGPVDLTNIDPTGIHRRCGSSGWSALWAGNAVGRPCLDWVIVGGESGRHARPMDVQWAEAIVAQCREAGTKVFVKQLGASPYRSLNGGADFSWVHLDHPKGADMAEWPVALRVREMPAGAAA